MTKNRRFPFACTKEKISLEDFTTTEEQLYPMIRQYASICRHNNNEKPRQSEEQQQQHIIPNRENSQLNEFIDHLKQERNDNIVDINNLYALRDHNIQYWKHVKCQWQKYYRNEIRREQDSLNNLIKTSHR
jgi:hypothetical protein